MIFEHATKKIELNSKPQMFFCWHPQAQLVSVTANRLNSQQIVQNTLCGIRYIVDADSESALRAIRTALTNRQAFCVHPQQYMPEPDDRCTERNTINNNVHLTDSQPDHQPDSHAEAKAVFQCLSSGTDGKPKRILRTHRSWISSFNINAGLADITSADSYAIIGRLSHSLTLYAALEAAHLGSDLHPLTELRPDRQLDAMAKLQSSILYATPTQLRLLCQHAKETDFTQLSVRHIFCGGGKLDQKTATSVSEVFQLATLQEFYGASETSFISITDDHTPVGSVGRPYPGVEIAIGATPNKNDGVSVHTMGKIWVRSPYLFQAYTDKHAQPAQWKDGYVSVGETGYFDSNGYLFLAGRQSRRVNIADTVVYPEEVEGALIEHPAVRACAVIPIEDDQRGCVLVAVVEAIDSPELKQDLLVYLRQCVGPLKAPRKIVFITEMPLLSSGKPDLLALEQRLSQQ